MSLIYKGLKRVLHLKKSNSKELLNNKSTKVKVPTTSNLDFGERFSTKIPKEYNEASIFGSIMIKVGRLAIRGGHKIVRTPLIRNFIWRRIYWTAGLTGTLGILTYVTSYLAVSQFLTVIYGAFKALFFPDVTEVKGSWLASLFFVAWKLTELTFAWVLISSIWNYPILREVVIHNWADFRDGGITLYEFLSRNMWTMWGFVQIPALQSLININETIRNTVQAEPGIYGTLFGGWVVGMIVFILSYFF